MLRHIDYIIHDVKINVLSCIAFLVSLCFSLQKCNYLIFTFLHFFKGLHKNRKIEQNRMQFRH